MSTATLLETYEDARLLFEAKGWGLAKAALHLTELAELARFHLNPTKLSQISRAGANRRIEPEVAAAVERMETRHGYERQTEIVTKGLLALHGDLSVDVGPVAAAELPGALKEALERKARVPKLSRAARRRITIAGSGAAVGCLALLVAPLLAGATHPGPLMLVVPDKIQPDGSPTTFDPRVLLDSPGALAWGEKPLDQYIPSGPLPGQRTPPCDASASQEEINGGCWVGITRKPPCGPYFRRGDQCYAPVAPPRKP